jgi:anaerobic selenocysteine-containing dehydrogenase
VIGLPSRGVRVLPTDRGKAGPHGLMNASLPASAASRSTAGCSRRAIGTNHVDGNTRLCTATAAEALKESFACDGQPGSYRDVDHADVIALYGHNVAETQTVLWMRMLDRLAGPNPPKLICVDPRETPVAQAATVHLAPLPGTNVALMNGLLHEIVRNDWVDHDYVAAHTVGFDELTKQVEDYPPDRVAGICQVPAEQIREAARILGTAQRLLSTVLQGFYQSHQATAAAVQVNNINIIRGMLGKPGAGVLQMNGQPSAENTRECGADGDLPGFRNWTNDSHVAELARIWNPRAAADPALRAAHPPDADDAVRGAGHHSVPVGQRHQPGGVAAGAQPDPIDPVPAAPVPGGPGHLPDRDD